MAEYKMTWISCCYKIVKEEMITLYIFFVDFIGNALIVLLGPISNTASLAYRCRFCC